MEEKDLTVSVFELMDKVVPLFKISVPPLLTVTQFARFPGDTSRLTTCPLRISIEFAPALG